MTIIRVQEFGGIVPMLDEKRLPENCAVTAENVDLRGKGIKPVFAPKQIRTNGSVLGGLTATIVQIPTACFSIRGNGVWAAYAYSAPPLGNYTVVAGDELWYAVRFNATGSARQGSMDLQFTDGTTLGGAIVDQNAINAITGDISAYASSNWYLRKIPLAGQLASDGTAITGKTISQVRLMGPTEAPAYFGMAFVRNGSDFRSALFDVDRQTELTNTGDILSAEYTTIDFDDMAYVFAGGNMGSGFRARGSVALAQFSGYARQKIIVATGGRRSSEIQSVYGRANHDAFVNAPNMPSLNTTNWAWKGYPAAGSANDHALGWVAVGPPVTAMTVAPSGGTPALVITRSYLFTHVSEDGLESGPSPAVTVTGNRDGVWAITNLPTWPGTDNFPRSTPVGSLLHKRRIYRTPEGSSTFKFVAEFTDDVTVIANDAALDPALGEELSTTSYPVVPALSHVATWKPGVIVGALDRTQVCVCVPFQYHAWPIKQRYTSPYVIEGVATMGDRIVAITNNKPVIFSGSDPEELVVDILENGEACINARAILQTGAGVIYPTKTGWARVNYSGYENLTKGYLTPENFAATIVDPEVFDNGTVAMFDDRRLYWAVPGGLANFMYAFEPGAGERALTTIGLPDTFSGTTSAITKHYLAMSYYAPRDTRWIAALNSFGSIVAIKLFDDTAQTLKWTWKSKFFRTPAPVRLKAATIDSNEWSNLGEDLRYREGFLKTNKAWLTGTYYTKADFVTEGGNKYRAVTPHTSGVFATDLANGKWILANTIYTVANTNLYVQAEKWCYLKVWADADRRDLEQVLVFDDYVVSDVPVRLSRSVKSDCWRFEIRGNMAITSIALAESEKELNQE